PRPHPQVNVPQRTGRPGSRCHAISGPAAPSGGCTSRLALVHPARRKRRVNSAPATGRRPASRSSEQLRPMSSGCRGADRRATRRSSDNTLRVRRSPQAPAARLDMDMTLWTEIARADAASGDDIILRRRDDIYEIRFNGIELMSSFNYQSETVLAE